eukprot:COSAG02_NODE_9077_length_2341_cov_2.221231_2_plen_109_part_00
MIVDVAAAELGVDLDPFDKQVDTVGGENRTPEMLKKNPSGGVPFLELTDGTCIAETVAIASYLEDAESTNGMPRHCALTFAIRAVRNDLPLPPSLNYPAVFRVPTRRC